MKNSRFSEAQFALAPRQAGSGAYGGEMCGKMGISEAAFRNWKKCSGLRVSKMRWLPQIE